MPEFADFFNKAFENPKEAAESFIEFYGEALRVAGWAIRRQPEMFGEMAGRSQPRFSVTEALAVISKDEGHPLREVAARALENVPDPRQIVADLSRDLRRSRAFETSLKEAAASIAAGSITRPQLALWAGTFGKDAERVLSAFDVDPANAAKVASDVAREVGRNNAKLNDQLSSFKGTHTGVERGSTAAFIKDRAEQLSAMREFECGLSELSRMHEQGRLTVDDVTNWAKGQRLQSRAAALAVSWSESGKNVFSAEGRAVGSEIRKLVAQKMDAERRIGETGLSTTRRRKEAVRGRREKADEVYKKSERDRLAQELEQSSNPAHRELAETVKASRTARDDSRAKDSRPPKTRRRTEHGKGRVREREL
ncbi:MAG: hypothetical protein MI741_05080 [Rhodospirillales bacterium]|nr:hypothetical protein [Rhodospirillales bacterium]